MNMNGVINQQAKILVIDDEIINLSILEELLEGAGYQFVDCEASPRKAITLYQNNDYDLVMLDLNMPDIDGFGVLAAFNEIALALPPPVLILTSLSDRENKLRGLREGARDYLIKPFDHDEALYRAANLIELHQGKKSLIDMNKELENKVIQRTKDLEAAKVDIVKRLAMAADYRDTETSEHTLRVGLITQLLGEKMGLGDNYCNVLLEAAPMHDIGKIGIPDRILLKPGRLSDEEMTIMRSHAVIGANMLADSPSEILTEAKIIAESHHERWDGSGYPYGLRETNIPLSGRLVIVADVFDALTTRRPYKEPWTMAATLDYLRQESGKMFDPDIIKIFLENSDEIHKIKEKFNDK